MGLFGFRRERKEKKLRESIYGTFHVCVNPEYVRYNEDVAVVTAEWLVITLKGFNEVDLSVFPEFIIKSIKQTSDLCAEFSNQYGKDALNTILEEERLKHIKYIQHSIESHKKYELEKPLRSKLNYIFREIDSRMNVYPDDVALVIITLQEGGNINSAIEDNYGTVMPSYFKDEVFLSYINRTASECLKFSQENDYSSLDMEILISTEAGKVFDKRTWDPDLMSQITEAVIQKKFL